MITVKLEMKSAFGGRYVAYDNDEAVGFLEFHNSDDCIKIHKLGAKRKREGIASMLIEQVYEDMHVDLETKYMLATATPDLGGPSREKCIESLIKRGIRVSGLFGRYEEADAKRKELIEKYNNKAEGN